MISYTQTLFVREAEVRLVRVNLPKLKQLFFFFTRDFSGKIIYFDDFISQTRACARKSKSKTWLSVWFHFFLFFF